MEMRFPEMKNALLDFFHFHIFHHFYKMNFSYCVNNRFQAYQDGDIIFNQFITKKDIHVILQCNNQDKSMLAFEKKKDDKYFAITKFDYVKENRLLIGENGDRWEGNSNKNSPYGFGKLFDDDGALVYEGFMYDGKKVCYGIEYFSDVYSVDYCGYFLNDKRHGFGKTFDRNKNLLYEGDWMDGNNDIQSIVHIVDNCENLDLIHKRIEELVIGKKCFNSLNKFCFENSHVLRKLIIGKNSFKNVNTFKMIDCGNVEEVIFGKYSFYNEEKGLVEFRNCEKLKRIVFENYVFRNFKGKFYLESI